MSWKEVSLMSQRFDFVHLAVQPGANISELCRCFQISRKTGYKFLNRFKQEGIIGICDRSRKPKTSPYSTD
jgi:transposase